MTDSIAQRRATCPNQNAHVKDAPSGYLQWHAWAERKAKTHTQSKCPGCGLYLIWTRREPADA